MSRFVTEHREADILQGFVDPHFTAVVRSIHVRTEVFPEFAGTRIQAVSEQVLFGRLGRIAVHELARNTADREEYQFRIVVHHTCQHELQLSVTRDRNGAVCVRIPDIAVFESAGQAADDVFGTVQQRNA